MKKMLYILCFIFMLINNIYASDNNFIMISFISQKQVDRSLPEDDIMAGDIEVNYKNKEVIKYTKKSCFNEIKNKMLESLKYGAEYYDNGVYYDRGYGRYVCLEYNIAKKYLYDNDLTYFPLQIPDRSQEKVKVYPSQFSKDFPNAIPYIVKEGDIKNYTIFPLMENQKEARKLSDKLNKEIKKELEKNK